MRPEDYRLPQGERLTEAITPAWNRLRKHWSEFRAAVGGLPTGEPGTGLTNDKWSLPLLRELGFGLLPATAGPEIDGRIYAISRFFGPVPVHLVGYGLSLDRRSAGIRGAASVNPHGLVQDFLNRSPAHLWGIVSNGMRLRILRDSQSLSRQSFLEYDLDSMFNGEVYSDFVLLWLVCHATRFAPRETDRVDTCWLELWTKDSSEQGTRALGDLRLGVQRALQTLGQGFTSHPNNTALRDELRTGRLTLAGFHGQLLRVIYRLIFLCVAEDREIDGQSLLHPQDPSANARRGRDRYAAYYSIARLRELAWSIKGSRHSDLWRQLQLVFSALSDDVAFSTSRVELALPILGSFLWQPSSTSTLNNSELTNYDMLDALRNLTFTRQGKVLRAVDFRNLGAEELGGVYESLLALTPQIGTDGAHFTFAEFAGNERKTSGSYYTPESLVQCLLDSTLDPVVLEAMRGKTGTEAAKAVMGLRVFDPTVGSGHFLVGAAHRLARHVARARALALGESEPSPSLYQHALRDVIGRCLYGVDVNPMAAELCRVSLWLEALEPGKPLSFLDHHIRVGNSLLGTTPELIAGGLPDDAFTAIEGDDKKACAALKKRNRAEREGMGPLFAEQDADVQARFLRTAAALEELPDDRPEDIRAKELMFRRHEQTQEYKDKKQLADSWCAAIMIRKVLREPGRESSAFGITQGYLNDLLRNGRNPDDLDAEVTRLSEQYSFFHWHLAFPEVFAAGGFDCVLGNPPWERVKLQNQEFFADRDVAIVAAPNRAARERLIEKLSDDDASSEDAALLHAFQEAKHGAAASSHFIRSSSRFPYASHGDINTYACFAELFRDLRAVGGRAGIIVPTGIATEKSNGPFFESLLRADELVSLYSFKEIRAVFPDTDDRSPCCVMTIGKALESPQFAFSIDEVSQISDDRIRFQLSTVEIARLSPNTRTAPVFRSRADAELVSSVYTRCQVLVDDANDAAGNLWKIHFSPGIHMSGESDSFRTSSELSALGAERRGRIWSDHEAAKVWLPLLEAKMIHQFNHRWGTFAGLAKRPKNAPLPKPPLSALRDANYEVSSWYWIENSDLTSAQGAQSAGWTIAWRDGARNNDVRSLIVAVVPSGPIVGDLPTFQLGYDARYAAALLATLNSLVVDYICRLKYSGAHIKQYHIKQLPVYPPNSYSSEDLSFLSSRVLELSYTSWSLEPFARALGYDDEPFIWDEERRIQLRAEIDAKIAQIYELTRDEVAYILDPSAVFGSDYPSETFRVLKKEEMKEFGEFRTFNRVLGAFDDLTLIRRAETSQALP